jgi:glycosyltransferase involved in cell wall biosynthesis
MFVVSLFRYRCLYVYFDGGPLGDTALLWRIEPWLYRLAGVRTVVMPYGGDVYDLSRSHNLRFKHAMAVDYPQHRLKRRRVAGAIDAWTRGGDHVIAGNDWVDFLTHWDTLLLAHFSLDTEAWRAPAPPRSTGPLRVLHAPNHRALKGTRHFVDAVEQLRKEGLDIELVVLERVSNERVREAIAAVDVVADQLVLGWYALFAIEAMAMERPVLCSVRTDLEELYVDAGLLERDELPLVRCTPENVAEVLRGLCADRGQLAEIGRRSREFVLRHHSLEVIGAVFRRINVRIGLEARPA